jgi:hypothetical protein
MNHRANSFTGLVKLIPSIFTVDQNKTKQSQDKQCQDKDKDKTKIRQRQKKRHAQRQGQDKSKDINEDKDRDKGKRQNTYDLRHAIFAQRESQVHASKHTHHAGDDQRKTKRRQTHLDVHLYLCFLWMIK